MTNPIRLAIERMTSDQLEDFFSDFVSDAGLEDYRGECYYIEINIYESRQVFDIHGDDGNVHLELENGMRVCFSLGQDTPRGFHRQFCRALVRLLGVELGRADFNFLVDCSM